MDFKALIEKRHSTRDFNPEKLPESLLLEVLDAGRMAPSAANLQPWLFIVVNNDETLQSLREAYPRDWFATAPQVIVICSDLQQSWKRALDQKDHADIDVAIATDHITLRAAEMGLGTCWVCNFNPARVSNTLQLPAHIQPVVLLPIGWPQKVSAPGKNRKPMTDITRFNGY